MKRRGVYNCVSSAHCVFLLLFVDIVGCDDVCAVRTLVLKWYAITATVVCIGVKRVGSVVFCVEKM